MRAGELRHRIEIQEKRALEVGSRGQQQFTWVEQTAGVPAAITTLSGRELEQSRQLVGEATVKVRLRYRPDLTIENRFKFGDRILDIGHIDNIDQRNLTLVCICSEGK